MTMTKDDERLVMLDIAADCMNRLARDTANWIDSSITAMEGKSLTVWGCMNMEELDPDVIERMLERIKTNMTDNDRKVTVPPDMDDPVITTNVSMNETDEYTRVTEITAKHYAPDAKWHEKDWLAKLERESEQQWQKLSDEDRQAMIVITKDCLRRMAEDPHVWLPSSMVAKTGNKLDLWICINFDDVDDEVIRRRTEAEKALLATQADLRKMEKELRPDSPEVIAQREAVEKIEESIRTGSFANDPDVSDPDVE